VVHHIDQALDAMHTVSMRLAPLSPG